MKVITYSICFLSMILFSHCATGQFHKNPVIAHRGAWKTDKIPQNSIAALNRAGELKCFGSEFDVHLTKDDILVVTHDHDFYGIDIESSTYQELLKKKHPNGESIPTAKEYLLAGKNHRKTKLIFELKASKVSKSRTLKAAEIAVNLVKELGLQKQVEYISFDYDALKKIVELDPKAKVAYLTGHVSPADARNDGLSGLDYHISFYKKYTNLIDESRDVGLTTNVWTVNLKEDMIWFLDKKIDYITTDEPELLFQVIKSK